MELLPAQLIQLKRDNAKIDPRQIEKFIAAVSRRDIPDYQVSAFLMAVFFRGMSLEETVALTRSMVESGERLDWSSIPGAKVDKHSTGGVGDKVSLILAPLAAACGLRVPMMAGRGLGHTGGTIDKLESIPGYRPTLQRSELEKILREVGCFIISQNEKIAPADRILYGLRDVTATIECVPLITGSILSKKIAEGAEALVLDLKVGNGAFMKTRTEARKLGKAILQVSRRLGLRTRVVLTSMDQPLGYAAGNSLEVLECIELLTQGEVGMPAALREAGISTTSSVDLKELTIQLCAQMLESGGVAKNPAEGRRLALARLQDGSAWKKFLEMVAAQGGDTQTLLHPEKLPLSRRTVVLRAKKKGWITAMDTRALGNLLVAMGGGRKKVGDKIDPGVGFLFHKKPGSKLEKNDPIVTVFLAEDASGSPSEAEVLSRLEASIQVATARKALQPLILEVVRT